MKVVWCTLDKLQLCKTSGLQQSVVGVAPGDGKRVLVTVQNKGVDIYDFDAKVCVRSLLRFLIRF